MGEKPALDQIVDAVAADPTETYDFTKDGKPVAVLVNYDQLQRLREAAGEPTTALELALDAVLARYKVQMFGFANGGDRGDLVSDLAEVARDFFGRQ